MPKNFFALFLIALGFALILYFLDRLLSAEPENLLAWAALALGAGANLKGWRDLFKEKPAAPPKKDERVQMMDNSADGEQSMKGRGGIQKQTMKNSPGGKQNME